ncbi:enoyl-CoA hydratase/isomerase family protein [Propylenella binzhouense]|uniref:Enoyl-CoA hydratase/isomerase family protein n=1 Tax=Propylenella binzhouense TaxID=2555902 RepID=A0A964T6I2_9HYPH|nr:enoyl-CoA hydratase/isomerase family protein [Propylenella binzhouense]MYZ48312.1 enoyl-CoA hydratase/isomerase family protein [Propylenella binzhouense]
MDSVLLEKRSDGVAIVTLNRPDVLNALDVPSKERLGAIWRDAASDPEVRSILLCGAGERAFCAGSDIKEISRTGRMVSTGTLLDAIPNVGVRLDKPVVAAIHGHCVGFGLTLAMHCDLKLARADARFGFPEVKHGMISGVSAVHLPKVVPAALAFEMLLLGEPFTAEEALARGLVNRVVEGDVRSLGEDWARRLASYSPVAVQATKRAALFGLGDLEGERAAIEAARAAVESKDDFRAGAEAFVRG